MYQYFGRFVGKDTTKSRHFLKKNIDTRFVAFTVTTQTSSWRVSTFALKRRENLEDWQG